MTAEQQKELNEVQDMVVELEKELKETQRFATFMSPSMLQLGIRHNDSKMTEYLQWRESLPKDSELYPIVDKVAGLYRETKTVLQEALNK